MGGIKTKERCQVGYYFRAIESKYNLVSTWNLLCYGRRRKIEHEFIEIVAWRYMELYKVVFSLFSNFIFLYFICFQNRITYFSAKDFNWLFNYYFFIG